MTGSMTAQRGINNPADPMTGPQKGYIEGLLEKRTLTDDRVGIDEGERQTDAQLRAKINRLIRTDQLTKGQAHDLIEWLKRQPIIAAPRPGVPWPNDNDNWPNSPKVATPAQPKSVAAVNLLPVGFYKVTENNETFYIRVATRKRRNSSIVYHTFTRINQDGTTQRLFTTIKLVSTMPGIAPVTIAETMALSAKFRHCMICGKKLHVKESVDRGIGPVCHKAQTLAVSRGY